MTEDWKMIVREAAFLAGRHARVIVVDNGLPLSDTVCPDSSLLEWVMLAGFCMAIGMNAS